MTTTPTRQPDAMRLADELDAESTSGRVSNYTGRRAATELRCQHAEIARLTAENRGLREVLSKMRTSLTDSEWLEYILRNGSKSDVHIATYEGVATTGAHGMVIRLQHDANNLRKLVESAYGIGEKP